MKIQSTATKFKLITTKDLIFMMKKLETESKGEGENLTEVMENIQYGLHLAFYETNLTKAKQDYNEFLETRAKEDNVEPFEKLTKKWEKEFKG